MPKLTSIDLWRRVEGQKKQIEYLQYELENYDSLQRVKCCECSDRCVEKYNELYLNTECFRDDYFKNLTFEDIAQLAKKSIRLTDDNNSKRHLIDDICELLNCEENEVLSNIKKLIIS